MNCTLIYLGSGMLKFVSHFIHSRVNNYVMSLCITHLKVYASLQINYLTFRYSGGSHQPVHTFGCCTVCGWCVSPGLMRVVPSQASTQAATVSSFPAKHCRL